MAITRILANLTVTELDCAQRWYTTLFGRGPDARPMDGLLEWHLGESFGVQVWTEPERAGRCTVVLDESDLDARATQLDRDGIEHEGPLDATTVRIMPLTDPDGNRIVFTGPLRG
ncbi:VOC family protein [Sciscionella sediminilitoris]|uniref:VOC family protein n=1 Tax=Sciscionella sediminilitoris TaxID=1445613 RepID=UPI0004DEE6F4|nr:VOC family protein [Sciscionella sp. SE31]